MPINPDLTEAERVEAQMLLAIGRLARFFKTPIPYFMGLDPVELTMWLDIMDEIVIQDNKATERELKKRGGH